MILRPHRQKLSNEHFEALLLLNSNKHFSWKNTISTILSCHTSHKQFTFYKIQIYFLRKLYRSATVTEKLIVRLLTTYLISIHRLMKCIQFGIKKSYPDNFYLLIYKCSKPKKLHNIFIIISWRETKYLINLMNKFLFYLKQSKTKNSVIHLNLYSIW